MKLNVVWINNKEESFVWDRVQGNVGNSRMS